MNKKNNFCVAFIFARGGSKGVPRKNVLELGGMPLIAHSIQCALNCPFVHRVVVSTDDEEIADIALQYGAEVPFIRPKELADDTSSEFEAWKHAIREYQKLTDEEFDVFVSLPPTSPLRSVEDVEACLDQFLTSDADMVVTVKEASRSPYFNMIRIDDEGFSHVVNTDPSGKRYTRRQDVPVVYDMTTVAYVSHPEFILNSDSVFSGKVKSVLVPDERALDIDTMMDFKFAEFLVAREELQ